MKSFRACVRGIASVMRSVRLKIALSIFIGLIRIAASLAFVWSSKRLIDIATGISSVPMRTGIITMVVVMILQLFSGLAASWWNSYITVNTKNKIRHNLFGHVIRSTWNGREAFHSGDTVNRLEEDLRVITDLICTTVPRTVITMCQLAAAALYLLNMTPTLVWVVIALMVVAVGGSRICFKVLRKLTAAIRARESEIQGYMQENLQNRIVVLTLVGTERVLEKLGWLQKDVRDNTVKRLNYNSVARFVMNLGFLAGYAFAFIWGVLGIKEGAITYGMMTAFLQLVGQVQSPIAELASQIPTFIHALTSMERLMELEELELEDTGDEVHIEGAPTIEIRNLTFSYEGQTKRVFENFSCTFEGGCMTAVSGHTGAGKSTLIKIVLALLKPLEGSVLVNGEPTRAGLRGNFMYVPQGNTLMSGTIRENLLLANADATEDEMRLALETASAGFVWKLPEGLDTVCSEKGAGLSEGQAQRISIARGLLHTGGVLILDEATSSVDARTEQKILENLTSLYRGRKTIIFISHREAVTKSADAILNLD